MAALIFGIFWIGLMSLAWIRMSPLLQSRAYTLSKSQASASHQFFGCNDNSNSNRKLKKCPKCYVEVKWSVVLAYSWRLWKVRGYHVKNTMSCCQRTGGGAAVTVVCVLMVILINCYDWAIYLLHNADRCSLQLWFNTCGYQPQSSQYCIDCTGTFIKCFSQHEPFKSAPSVFNSGRKDRFWGERKMRIDCQRVWWSKLQGKFS